MRRHLLPALPTLTNLFLMAHRLAALLELVAFNLLQFTLSATGHLALLFPMCHCASDLPLTTVTP